MLKTKPISVSSLETVLVNTYGTKTRIEKLHGRDHIVAPLTLIVPGVLSGSKGALYYPLQEIAKNPDAWNGMPLVKNHPVVNGRHVSARTPEILNQSAIGVVLRARVNNKGKLVAEGWFDIEKTKQVDISIYESLKANRQIELSTGLFTDNYPAPQGATFNGRAYVYTAKNYRPDHLAILPDQVGACSLRDGCGVLVNESTVNHLKQIIETRKKLTTAQRVEQILNYNPSQPRDSRGRWGSGGGGGGGGSAAPSKSAVSSEEKKTEDELNAEAKKRVAERVKQVKAAKEKGDTKEVKRLLSGGKPKQPSTTSDKLSQDYMSDDSKGLEAKITQSGKGKNLTHGINDVGKTHSPPELAKWDATVRAKAEKFKREPVVASKYPHYEPDVDAVDHNGITTHARVGVPAHEIPPPPKVPRMPNLTPQERRVESKFIAAFEKDPEGMTQKFKDIVAASTKPGDPPTFGTDDAKALTSAWSHPDPVIRAKNRATLNTPLHQTANAIAKKAFVEHLDTLKPGDEVLVTVGGCGAGKGYALKNVPDALDMKKRSKAVWDSAGDQNATENPWIQKELESRGLKGNYVYVHADPRNQWAHPERGVVKRAADPSDGRMVDAKVFADSYAIGARNHQAFHDTHRDNPNANFVFLENAGTPKKLAGIPPESLTIDRHELAAFAISTVSSSDAPAHVKRGATSGTRIWTK